MSEAPPIPASDADATPSRRGRWVGWVIVVMVLGVLLVALVGSMSRSSSGARITHAVATGQHPMAPPLAGTTLTSTVNKILVWRGHVTVVNFWASWCGPCDAETTDLTRLDRDWQGTRVRIVGADPATEDTADAAAAFVRSHRMHYQVLRFHKDAKRDWGVTGYPETFVVAPTGRIVAKFDGPIDVDRLRAAVNAELDASA